MNDQSKAFLEEVRQHVGELHRATESLPDSAFDRQRASAAMAAAQRAFAAVETFLQTPASKSN
jgi:hypothetical protein